MLKKMYRNQSRLLKRRLFKSALYELSCLPLVKVAIVATFLVASATAELVQARRLRIQQRLCKDRRPENFEKPEIFETTRQRTEYSATVLKLFKAAWLWIKNIYNNPVTT
jgi:hypothetical protein